MSCASLSFLPQESKAYVCDGEVRGVLTVHRISPVPAFYKQACFSGVLDLLLSPLLTGLLSVATSKVSTRAFTRSQPGQERDTISGGLRNYQRSSSSFETGEVGLEERVSACVPKTSLIVDLFARTFSYVFRARLELRAGLFQLYVHS